MGKIIRKIEVEDLAEPVNMPIGKVKVYSVNNENSSIVEIVDIENGENVKKGDIIRFKK